METIIIGFIYLYFQILILSVIDFIPLMRLWFVKKISINSKWKNNDFTLLIPIHTSTKYLDSIEPLVRYGNKLVLITSIYETKEFYTSLEIYCC